MSEKRSSIEERLFRLVSFVEKFPSALKHPLMKLIGLFAVVLLLVLLLTVSIPPYLGLVLLVVVVLTSAFLVAALQYAEMRLRYTKRTEEQLKRALRDTVMELQEEKMKRLPRPYVSITYIECDPPGDDVQGEFLRIENSSRTAADMTDWTLCDEAGHEFTFPTFVLKPGAYVRVWTKARKNTSTDLYWGREQAVWNRTGDCAYLRDSTGKLIHAYRY